MLVYVCTHTEFLPYDVCVCFWLSGQHPAAQRRPWRWWMVTTAMNPQLAPPKGLGFG